MKNFYLKGSSFIFVLGFIITINGCAAHEKPEISLPTPPPLVPEISLPTPPPLETIHTLSLKSPMGGTGSLVLTKKIEYILPRSRVAWLMKLGNGPGYKVVQKYLGLGQIQVTDDLGEWKFTYSPMDLKHRFEVLWKENKGLYGLGIQFSNRTQEAIEVDWNRTVLVDANGHTHKVIHRGVRLVDRESLLPPSVVPSGSTLEDFVFPTDLITYESGEYRGWEANGFFKEITPPSQFFLHIELKTSNDKISRKFVFISQ